MNRFILLKSLALKKITLKAKCEYFHEIETNKHLIDTSCPQFEFNGLNGEIHCKTENETKKCVLDCNIGYVPSSIEVFSCSFGQSKWTTLDGNILKDVSNITCERPVAIIAGGKYILLLF